MEWISENLSWLVELFRDEDNKLRIELIGGVLVAAFLAIFWRLITLFGAAGRAVIDFFRARKTLDRIRANMQRIQKKGRWSEPVLSASRDLQAQQRRSNIPILMVANHKGGVGKTTLASNLGAYFAARHEMNVLFIDLDWQGTLSATLQRLIKDEKTAKFGYVNSILRDPFPEDRADRFIEARGKLQGVRISTNDTNIQDSLRGSAFFAADDALADLEDWLMMKWVTARQEFDSNPSRSPGTRRVLSDDDIRFRLLRFLLSKQVQNEYQMVILDAPPRDTTAGINGLCAATHLVVPTRADSFSTAGALKFVERVAELHDRLCPNAAMLGFVATMISRNQTEPDSERTAREILMERAQTGTVQLRGAGSLRSICCHYPAGSRFDFTPPLYHDAIFKNFAGRSVAYLQSNDIRTQIIDPIGDELWARMQAIKAQHEREDV